jgi:hypothetical protein
MYLFSIDLSAFLVQKKKNTIFDPIQGALFSEQCGIILVYSGSSRRDLQESYPMSHGISYTHNVTPQERPKFRSKNERQIRYLHGLKPPSYNGTKDLKIFSLAR